MPLAPIAIDPGLVSACGLYCGACRRFRAGKCPGCRANAKASWCKVRSCNQEHGTDTCAQCATHDDPLSCAAFDNPIARVFGFVFNSDRAAGIRLVRAKGREEFARVLAASGRQAIPRRGKRPDGA